jgi:hypothetical protein
MYLYFSLGQVTTIAGIPNQNGFINKLNGQYLFTRPISVRCCLNDCFLIVDQSNCIVMKMNKNGNIKK